MMVIGVAYIHLRSETERERSEFRTQSVGVRESNDRYTPEPSGV
nr:MAG TPA: hypothetical protein [Microviridae sp.]